MKIGLIGLGKMGFGMAERLIANGIDVTATAKTKETLEKAKKAGVNVEYSIKNLVENLDRPRIIWLMIPEDAVDDCIAEVLPRLNKGDIIVDGGNSFYRDSIKRAGMLREKGIYFLDVGTSGGIKIGKGEACMMVGGERKAYEIVEPVFKAVCVKNGYKLVGESGAGHFVKGYHNFIEYGMMQAIAEGSSAIKTISEKEGLNIDLKEVLDLWNQGSINQSKLVEYAKEALESIDIDNINGRIFGVTAEEMKTLAELAENSGVKVPVGKAAIEERIKSQTNPTFTSKLINAIRNIFGGHIW